jgi:hypothetical protein
LYCSSPLLLLLFLGLGLSGVMAGLTWYVTRRSNVPPPAIRPLRQGLWSALFVIICGWLLVYRAFMLPSVALLGGGLVLIEAFLAMRESSGNATSTQH